MKGSAVPVHVVSGTCPTWPLYGVPATAALARSFAADELALILNEPAVETLPVGDNLPALNA